MTTDDFPARRTELRQGYRDLAAVLPEQMKGFGALHRTAMAEGALSAARCWIRSEALAPRGLLPTVSIVMRC